MSFVSNKGRFTSGEYAYIAVASGWSDATDAKNPADQTCEDACSKYEASHCRPELLHVSVHVSEPPVPFVQATVPQSVAAEDPGKAVFPAGQAVQAPSVVDAKFVLYLLAAQVLQAVSPPASLYLPVWHC